MKNLYSLVPGNWRNLLVLAGGLLASTRAHAQAPAWQTAVAAAGDVVVQAVATGANGDVYLTGGFGGGTATFGTTTLTTANSQEVFVAKWSPASNSFAWAVQGTGTGTGTNSANALTVSGSNIYIAGGFTSASLVLGNVAPLATAGGSDIFVAKLVDAGTSASFTSAVRAGGAGNDYATTIVASGSLYQYVGGVNGTGAVFNNGSSGPSTLANAGGFVARLTDSGSLGSLQYPTPAGDAVTALAYNGVVYATGTLRTGAATFGIAGFGTAPVTLASAGGEDAFVARFSAFQLICNWAQALGGTGDDYGQTLLSSGSALYLAGVLKSPTVTLGSTTLTSSSAGNMFVTRLTDTNTQGSYQWALPGGGAGSTANRVAGLAATGTSVYLAGSFGGSASFGATTLTSAGASDMLLAKLTDRGTSAAFIWAQQAGGAGPDYGAGLVRNGAQLYVAGQVTAPATFGSLSLGTTAGVRPGYLASLTDPAPVLTLAAPTSAQRGSTITLYGSGLAGTTAITFAGSSNNVVTSGFTVNAAGTQISGVVVPAGAQTGTLDVTTPLGTSNGLTGLVVAPINPAPAWQSVAATTGGRSSIQYTSPDASGNILVAGTFSGTCTLGGTTLTSAGANDVFVAKWSPARGTYLWAQRAGGPGADAVYGLAVNGANVYAIGYFEGRTAAFGNITLLNTATNNSLDGYVAKLTDAGSSASFTWAQLIGGEYDEFVESIAVNGANVYVGGDFFSSALLIGSGGLSTNASGFDGFVAKLVDAGPSVSLGWALGSGTSANDGGAPDFYGLAVRGNTVYAAGYFTGTLNFGSTQVAAADKDVVVTRIIDAGSTASFTGAAQAGGTGDEYVMGLIANGNNLYVSGYSNSPTSTWGAATLTNAGSSDGFVAKLTDTGSVLSFGWAQLLGGSASDYVYRLAASGNNVYAAGYYNGTASFGGTTLTSLGSSNGFVAKLLDAGTSASVAWVQESGGMGSDVNYGVALSGNTVYVGSYVTPAAAFGSLAIPGPATGTVATLATLTDATLLATAAPAAALVGAAVLYPNPAHGTTTIRLAAGAEKQPLSLLDAVGREMRRYPAPAASATEATLDLTGLPAGLYVLRGSGSSQKLQVQ